MIESKKIPIAGRKRVTFGQVYKCLVPEGAYSLKEKKDFQQSWVEVFRYGARVPFAWVCVANNEGSNRTNAFVQTMGVEGETVTYFDESRPLFEAFREEKEKTLQRLTENNVKLFEHCDPTSYLGDGLNLEYPLRFAVNFGEAFERSLKIFYKNRVKITHDSNENFTDSGIFIQVEK